ncbi:MAG: hypothetical protein AAF335_01195 [Bacteroidota bacterium]
MVDSNRHKKIYLLFLIVVCCPSKTFTNASLRRTSSEYKEYQANQLLLKKLLADYPLGEQEKIKEHLRREAKKLSSPNLAPKQKVKKLAEIKLRDYYKRGIKEQELFLLEEFIHVHPKTMPQIRKKLYEEIEDELLVHAGLNTIVSLSDPSPKEVLSLKSSPSSPPQKEPLFRFFQVLYYTTNNDLQKLYQAIEKDKTKRKQLLYKLLKQDVLQEAYPIEYSNVKDKQGHVLFTRKNIPEEISKVLQISKKRPLTVGLLSSPHTYIDKNGLQAQRLIFVEKSTFPHPDDDYLTKENAYIIAQQKKKLNTWWKKYREEATE